MSNFEIKRARGKTAVFAGTKQHCDFVPKLEDLCLQKLLTNLNRIECVGDVPYYILKPLLTKISFSQLRRIESYNPTLHLIQQLFDDDQSDEPWKTHCERHFEGKVPRPNETWRELFARCERDRDHKIEKITKRIKKHEKKAIPVRQAKVVQEQLPGGQHRAISSSTVITKTFKSHVPPKHSLAHAASSSGGQSASTSTTTVVIRRETNNASNGSNSRVKPKTAPLMQKSMQLFKSRFRR